MRRRATVGERELDRPLGRGVVTRDGAGPMSRADAALQLQRQAGNRAVTSLLGGSDGGTLTLQRDDDLEGLDTANRVGGFFDTANLVSGQVKSGYNLPGFNDPNFSTTQGTVGGITTPAIGVVTGGIGLGLAGKRHHEARTALKTKTAGTAGHKAAKREVVTSGGDVAEKTLGTASGIAGTVAGGMAAGGASGAQIAGAIAAPLTLPLSVLQAVRWGRKAHGARLRSEALQALITSEDTTIDPNSRLKALEDRVAALQTQQTAYSDALAEANTEVAEAERTLQRLQLLRRPTQKQQIQALELAMSVVKAKALVTDVQKDLDATATNLQAATLERDQVKTAREAMDKAVKEESAIVASGKTEQVSLRMIQAYALKKNQRGLVKKIVNTVGGIVGAGAGVAGTIAAIAIAAGATAGAGVLMATPVGWALAGTAALIGLTMAGYSAWKFFSKRWKRTGAMKDSAGSKLGFGARLGKTLAFWKQTGPSRRELYAERLYDLAKDDTGPNQAKAREARETIKALGLDWAGTNMASDKPASVKLIAAKMGS